MDERELLVARADVGEDAQTPRHAEDRQHVGIARAIDAGRADDGDRKAVGGMEDVVFAGEFRSAIEIVRVRRDGFILGFGGRIGADGGERRYIDEAAKIRWGGLNNACGGVGIGCHVLGKCPPAREAGHMEKEIGVRKPGVAGMEFDREAGERCCVRSAAGQADDPDALGQKTFDQMTADKSGGSCDDGFRGRNLVK
jgi:hypothetical protein